MALAFQIVYTVVDDDDDEATFALPLPSTFSLADYTSFGSQFATLVDKILDGKITNAGLNVAVDISSIPLNVASSLSDVQEVGQFIFSTADGRKVTVNVPGMDDSFVVSGTDDIDTGETKVSAFLTAMQSGLTTVGGNIAPTDIGEDDVVDLLEAREAFRTRRKGR